MLTKNKCKLFMKPLYWLYIYIAKFHTYLNCDHHISVTVTVDNISIHLNMSKWIWSNNVTLVLCSCGWVRLSYMSPGCAPKDIHVKMQKCISVTRYN